MSHTTKVKVEYLNLDALRAAVEAIGGSWIGHGTHHIFSGNYEGTGFQLPGWHYPCILQDGGTLAYDNYNGAWGSADVLGRLNSEYALQAAEAAARSQGWYCERQGAALSIYHPDGGTITVDAAGAVDASMFLGADCVAACAPIESALGSRSERTLKAEFYSQKQHITAGGE